MTPKQWAEAEALWESGEVTLDELATKFGKHKSNFSRYFAKNGIKHGAKAEEHKKRVSEAVTAASVDDSTILAARIRETKEEHYKMAAGLGKLVWAELLKAKTDHQPMSVATNNLKALDIAATALKKVREERWAILGLDRPDFVDEEGLPELTINELTAEQIDEMRARDEASLVSDDEIADVIQDSGDIVDEKGED